MNLKKIKNKVLSFSITSALISSITAINAYAADNNAGVDISGGINKAINEVKIQFKDVVAVIFGFLTLVTLTVAVAKLVKGLLSHRNQGTGMAFGATIVCGVVAGAGFFGWFGLS